MDALNCQAQTASQILSKKADYVLSVKKNQQNLYDDIAEILEFKQSDGCESKTSPLDSATKTEKGHGRIDSRTAVVTHEVEWLQQRCKFAGVKTIGAIMTKTETRYYISSRTLTSIELLTITRQEWAVESMHWQLDVIFGEDVTTLHERNAQIVLNILRKTVLNLLRAYRDKHEPKLNMTDIMRKCLHDFDMLLVILEKFA